MFQKLDNAKMSLSLHSFKTNILMNWLMVSKCRLALIMDGKLQEEIMEKQYF